MKDDHVYFLCILNINLIQQMVLPFFLDFLVSELSHLAGPVCIFIHAQRTVMTFVLFVCMLIGWTSAILKVGKVNASQNPELYVVLRPHHACYPRTKLTCSAVPTILEPDAVTVSIILKTYYFEYVLRIAIFLPGFRCNYQEGVMLTLQVNIKSE